ncbi:MAG: hypothetical protein ACRD1X_06785 [Vicinamibacteria bacterium]
MRAKKPDLERVKAEFVAWRRERRGRAIPEQLWGAALRLLDRHSSSTICAALGLNATRFKRAREAGSGKANGFRDKRGGRRDQRAEVGRDRGTSLEPISPMSPAFIELPPLGVGGSSLMAGGLGEVERAGSGCRLTLESAFGSLSVVTLRRPEEGLVEAVCRWALGAPADSFRS